MVFIAVVEAAIQRKGDHQRRRTATPANPAVPQGYDAMCRWDAVPTGIASHDRPVQHAPCATQAATWCTEFRRLSPQHPMNASEFGHQGVANALWEKELPTISSEWGSGGSGSNPVIRLAEAKASQRLRAHRGFGFRESNGGPEENRKIQK